MNENKIPTLHKTDVSITTETGRVIAYPMHSHSYCELLLYEPFDGCVRINGQEIVTDAPTATLIVPGDFHEIILFHDTDSLFRKISFPGNLFENLPFALCSTVFQPVPTDGLLFRNLTAILERDANEALKRALLEVVICLLAQSGRPIDAAKHTDACRYSAEAVRIIHEHYADLSLTEAASRLGVTPQYLSTVFKADIGIPFSGYLTIVRLQQAEKLLIETDVNVTAISERCGYGNFSHFIRSFKKTYGVSPSVYRKNGRKP